MTNSQLGFEQLREQVLKLGHVVVPKMDESLYHSLKGFTSHSMLKSMRHSPAKFRWAMDNPQPPSPAMTLGSAIHMALLEPDKFESTYAAMPKCDRRTKEGKAQAEEWQKANVNKIPLSIEEMDTIARVHAKTYDDPFFQKFLSRGVKECSFFAKEPETGLLIRGRLDNYIEEMDVIVDLKTCDSADKHSFMSDITKYQYFTQAAFYVRMVELCTGKKPKAFVILAVEKTKDCDIRAFSVSPKSIEYGWSLCSKWLQTLKQCIETNRWPGYEREFIPYNIPQWLLSDAGLTE